MAKYISSKGEDIGTGGDTDWSNIENVPQVLNDFSDDGTGLKYKGADIGGSTPEADELVANSKVLMDPNPPFTALGFTTPVHNWCGVATLNGVIYAADNNDVYKVVDNTLVGFGLGSTSRSGLVTIGNDVYALSNNIHKQTNGEGAFVSLGVALPNGNLYSGLCKLGNDFWACVGNSTTTGMIYKQTNGKGSFMSLAYTAQKYTGIVAYGNDLYVSVYGADIYKLVNGWGTLTAVNGEVNNWQNIIAINDRMYAASKTNALIYKYDIATSKFLPHGIRISGALIKLGAYSNGLLVGAESSGDLYYQKEVKALNVFSLNEEVETNTTWLGHKLYTKVINFGALPNATSKSIAHGISGSFYMVNRYLVSENPSITTGKRTLIVNGPYGTREFTTDNTYATYSTIYNDTAYTKSYAILEYIKATL